MASKPAVERIRTQQRRVTETVRKGTFGAQRPRRWFATFLRRAAEVIEPAKSDPRVILPEEPPQMAHMDASAPPEMRSQRDSPNSETRGARPERD